MPHVSGRSPPKFLVLALKGRSAARLFFFVFVGFPAETIFLSPEKGFSKLLIPLASPLPQAILGAAAFAFFDLFFPR